MIFAFSMFQTAELEKCGDLFTAKYPWASTAARPRNTVCTCSLMTSQKQDRTKKMVAKKNTQLKRELAQP